MNQVLWLQRPVPPSRIMTSERNKYKSQKRGEKHFTSQLFVECRKAINIKFNVRGLHSREGGEFFSRTSTYVTINCLHKFPKLALGNKKLSSEIWLSHSNVTNFVFWFRVFGREKKSFCLLPPEPTRNETRSTSRAETKASEDDKYFRGSLWNLL